MEQSRFKKEFHELMYVVNMGGIPVKARFLLGLGGNILKSVELCVMCNEYNERNKWYEQNTLPIAGATAKHYTLHITHRFKDFYSIPVILPYTLIKEV